MYKLIFLLLFINPLLGQITLEPDTTYVKLDKTIYRNITKRNDSLSKIKLEKDITSIYLIIKIIVRDDFYIIEAKKDKYFYRIKSNKMESISDNQIKIEVGNYYQLDVRDYNNHNLRLHFSDDCCGPNLLINCEGKGDWDMVCRWAERINKDKYNIALNLNGLSINKDY